jgi:membrane associated rhomboid family serine protease
MDWSLVLISQGIESVVLPRASDGVWILEVPEADAQRASESIAAYQGENARRWRRELKWTGLLFDARAALWFLALAVFHLFELTSQTDFRSAGAVDRVAVLHGEWWRLFTAVTLHADIAHLATNVTIGIIFLGLAMAAFGPGTALLFSFIGGALGNAVTLGVHGAPFRSLGASGMVMASLGLLTAHSLIAARHEKRTLWVGRGVLAGCLLVVLLGFSPRSDVVAHVGGFITGILLGVMACVRRGFFLRKDTNVVALFVTALVVLATWWAALK